MKDVTKQTNVVAVELDGWQTQQPKRMNPRFTFPAQMLEGNPEGLPRWHSHGHPKKTAKRDVAENNIT